MKRICSVILAIILVVAASFCLVACTPKIADNTEHYDKITKSLKLNRTYQGKSFLTDGIGEAVVVSYTDGDTTRFRLVKEDQEIIVRYYCINTPESTGTIEKWGKAASNFTRQQLQTAEQVVLEASEERAVKDSYGTRYLGYVWYKSAGEKDFKNLNLELVENGFTQNKGAPTDAYYTEFQKAANFAKSVKLRINSDLDDPLYSSDPFETTLKDIVQKPDEYYNVEAQAGMYVKVQALLTDLSIYVGDSGSTYTFTAAQVDGVTGEKYTYNVYAGYSSSNATNMKIGHLYKMVGNVQLHGSHYQLTNITYSTRYNRSNTTNILQKDYMLTFNSSKEWTVNWSDTLYTNATVVSSKVENGALIIVATANARETASAPNEQAETYTFKVKVPNGYVNEFSQNDEFSVQGYQFVADSGEITVLNYSDITKIIK